MNSARSNELELGLISKDRQEKRSFPKSKNDAESNHSLKLVTTAAVTPRHRLFAIVCMLGHNACMAISLIIIKYLYRK